MYFIYYVQTQNPNLPKLKNEMIYKSILQKGSQKHITFGETLKNGRIK